MVADAFGRKPCEKSRRTRPLKAINQSNIKSISVHPIRFRALNVIIRSNLSTSIRIAQEEAFKDEKS